METPGGSRGDTPDGAVVQVRQAGDIHPAELRAFVKAWIGGVEASKEVLVWDDLPSCSGREGAGPGRRQAISGTRRCASAKSNSATSVIRPPIEPANSSRIAAPIWRERTSASRLS